MLRQQKLLSNNNRNKKALFSGLEEIGKLRLSVKFKPFTHEQRPDYRFFSKNISKDEKIFDQ
jgi:hypothetical protein